MTQPTLANRLAALRVTDETARARFYERAESEGLIDVAYTLADSPVGPLLLAATPRGLVRIAYSGSGDVDEVLDQLAGSISPRVIERRGALDPTLRQLDQYFEGARHEFELETDWSLMSPFTERVMRQTASIPFGETSTYGAIAAAAGSPRAARAVGNALHVNPIAIVLPCHRVLRSGGVLGGYGGGVDAKRALLTLEGAGLSSR